MKRGRTFSLSSPSDSAFGPQLKLRLQPLVILPLLGCWLQAVGPLRALARWWGSERICVMDAKQRFSSSRPGSKHTKRKRHPSLKQRDDEDVSSGHQSSKSLSCDRQQWETQEETPYLRGSTFLQGLGLRRQLPRPPPTHSRSFSPPTCYFLQYIWPPASI